VVMKPRQRICIMQIKLNFFLNKGVGKYDVSF